MTRYILFLGLASCTTPNRYFELDPEELTTSGSGQETSVNPSGPDVGSQPPTNTSNEGSTNPEDSESGNGGPTQEPEFVCGNGVLEPGELCDDGECSLGSLRCNDGLYPSGLEDDPVTSPHCTDDCIFGPYCGNLIQESPELCDEGSENTGAYNKCNPSCTALASCGDGVLQEGFEQCDDGNLSNSDRCDDQCVQTLRVFVTSEIFNGGLGGLDAAQLLCEPLAGNPNALAKGVIPSNFKVWLSVVGFHPSKTFKASKGFEGNYRLMDSDDTIVAEGWTGLTSLPLLAPLMIDESGEIPDLNISEKVWTGTLENGMPVNGPDCNSWTNGNDGFGVVGQIWDKISWSNDLQFPISCNLKARLYCFEDL